MPEPPPEAASAVVVAAGRGERFGGADKVLLSLAGRPALAHILDALDAATSIHEVVLVVGEHLREHVAAMTAGGAWLKPRLIVSGGARRQDSVAAGLAATSPDLPIVAIHDGARPLATPDLFDRTVAAAALHGAAIAAVPLHDTLKRVAAGRVVETLPREGLWSAQTPQAARRDLLLAAFAAAPVATETYTDEASLLEALGIPVVVVEGHRANLKLTVPADLALAEALLGARAGLARAGG